MKVSKDLENLCRQRVRESISAKEALAKNSALIQVIVEVAGQIAKCLRGGGKVLLFGNGGSAADAQHIAAEFVGRYLHERPGLPAIALTVDTSALTAVSNDYGFEMVFARQLEVLGRKGDVAVAISTSGNSPNVLRAVEVARASGLLTVGLTGGKGGRLKRLVDYCVCVPSGSTPRIQESHILVGHIICEIVEMELFG